MSLEILRLDPGEAQGFASELAELERDVWYPLGDDRFRIDHGPRYTAFFERLGEVHVHLARSRRRVVGVLVAVLRRSPLDGRELWYLADLKSRAHGAAVTAALWHAFRGCAEATSKRGFAVSMEPSAGANRLVRMALRRLQPRPRVLAHLHFHFLDGEGARRAVGALQPLLGPIAFLDLRGKKDLVLASTGRPWPLVHAQMAPWGATGEATSPPRDGNVHGFCTVEGSVAAARLAAIAPVAARATLLAHGLGIEDIGAPLTSDI